ncbi:hypothetical protein PIB30_005302 [Stylosanthes scabra]|uniref:Uncharacterized protein n=1 Tax=Stylosanthes scabra TaxID=79078 RepID=A0ABU6U4U8_9FABA|nr:hypothetical protein [Stylosanthes scabra]
MRVSSVILLPPTKAACSSPTKYGINGCILFVSILDLTLYTDPTWQCHPSEIRGFWYFTRAEEGLNKISKVLADCTPQLSDNFKVKIVRPLSFQRFTIPHRLFELLKGWIPFNLLSIFYT